MGNVEGGGGCVSNDGNFAGMLPWALEDAKIASRPRGESSIPSHAMLKHHLIPIILRINLG